MQILHESDMNQESMENRMPQTGAEALERAPLLDAEREQQWNAGQLLAPVVTPAVRIWQYGQGAVVLGRSQHRLADEPGAGSVLPLVKRGAGGGAVLVGPWMLSASFLLPLDDPRIATTSVADSYRWLGEAMVRTLHDLGVEARAVPPASQIKAPASLSWACFAGIAPWEVVVDDPAQGMPRKLVGFAQRRSRHGVLLAMGMLVHQTPWHLMADTLGQPREQAAELAASTIDLDALCPSHVSTDRVIETMLPYLQPVQRI